jgi:serine/threonine protein phosphatase PrpC
MVNKEDKVMWLCCGKTVQGASHQSSGLPNQDSITWLGSPEIHEGPPEILAVSDGHGSAKSFRSDLGSKFAVKVATKIVKDFFLDNRVNSDVNLATLKDLTQRRLPPLIVEEWEKEVKKHLQEHPFSELEKQILLEKVDENAVKSIEIERNQFLVYGATLLVVLITDSYIVYIQLGDGDILAVDSQGKSRRPIVKDDRLLGNETTSLCSPKAWNEFQVEFELYSKETLKQTPSLILVSTDGYANSFTSDEDFFKIGSDYLKIIREQGMYFLEEQLESFLKETSKGGSGDDITLGIIERLERVNPDYTSTLTYNNTQKIEEMQESMSQNTENNLNLEKKIDNLYRRQKITNNRLRSVFIGLFFTFLLALGSLIMSIKSNSDSLNSRNNSQSPITQKKNQ